MIPSEHCVNCSPTMIQPISESATFRKALAPTIGARWSDVRQSYNSHEVEGIRNVHHQTASYPDYFPELSPVKVSSSEPKLIRRWQTRMPKIEAVSFIWQGSGVSPHRDLSYSSRNPPRTNLNPPSDHEVNVVTSIYEANVETGSGLSLKKADGSCDSRLTILSYSSRNPTAQTPTPTTTTTTITKQQPDNSYFARMRRMQEGKKRPDAPPILVEQSLEENAAFAKLFSTLKYQTSKSRKALLELGAPGVEDKATAMEVGHAKRCAILSGSLTGLEAKMELFGVCHQTQRPHSKMYLPKSEIDIVRDGRFGPLRTNLVHLVLPKFLAVEQILNEADWELYQPTDAQVSRALRARTLLNRHDEKIWKLLSKQSSTFITALLVNNLQHISCGTFDPPGRLDETDIARKERTSVFQKRLYRGIQKSLHTHREELSRSQRTTIYNILNKYFAEEGTGGLDRPKDSYHIPDEDLIVPFEKLVLQKPTYRFPVPSRNEIGIWYKPYSWYCEHADEENEFLETVFDYKQRGETLITIGEVSPNGEISSTVIAASILKQTTETVDWEMNTDPLPEVIPTIDGWDTYESGWDVNPGNETTYVVPSGFSVSSSSRAGILYEFGEIFAIPCPPKRTTLIEQISRDWMPGSRTLASVSNMCDEIGGAATAIQRPLAHSLTEISKMLSSFNEMCGSASSTAKNAIMSHGSLGGSFNSWCVNLATRVAGLIIQLSTRDNMYHMLLDCSCFMMQFVDFTSIFTKVKDSLFFLVQLLYRTKTESDDDENTGETTPNGTPVTTVDDLILVEQTWWKSSDDDEGRNINPLDPEFWGLNDIDKKLVEWGKVAGGVKSIWTLAENIARFIMNHVLPSPTVEEVFQKKYHEVHLWILEIQSVIEAGGVEEIAKDVSLALKASSLYRKGMTICREFYNQNPPREAKEIFTKFLSSAKELSNAASSCTNSTRPAPVVVWLSGPPGTGKSSLVNALTRALCEKRGMADPTAERFSLPPGDNGFFDGYHGQFVFSIDDIFQSNDVTDRRRQALTMIHAAGDSPYALDMAGVESKGKFFFTSPVVVATTNLSNTTEIGITEISAFHRRIDLDIEVTVKPQYATNGKIDLAKLQAVTNRPNDYNVNVLNLRNKSTNINLTFDELVASVDSRIAAYNQRHKNQMSASYRDPLPGGEFDELQDERDLLALLVEDLGSPSRQQAPPQEMIAMLSPKGKTIYERCVTHIGLFTRLTRTLSDVYRENQNAINTALGVLATMALGATFISMSKTKKKPKTKHILEGLIPSGDPRTRSAVKIRQTEGLIPSGDPRTRSAVKIRQTEGLIPSGDPKSQSVVRPRVPVNFVEEAYEDDVKDEHVLDVVYGPLVEQGNPDPQALQLINFVLINQVYRFSLVTWDEKGPYEINANAHILMIGGLCGLMPYHSIKHIEESTHMFLYGSGSTMSKPSRIVPIDKFTIPVTADHADLAVVLFGRNSSVQRHQMLVDKFISVDDLKMNLDKASLVVRNVSSSPSQVECFTTLRNSPDDMTRYNKEDAAGVRSKLPITRGFCYPDIPTTEGYCGSPLVVYNTCASGKILGLHYLGTKHEMGGWSTIITREFLNKILAHVDMDAGLMFTMPNVIIPEKIQEAPLVEHGGFEYLGRVPKNMHAHQNEKSKIIKSPFYECFGPATTAPAVLVKTNGIDPRDKARQKNFGLVRDIPTDKMDQIYQYMKHWLCSLKKRDFRVLSVLEAFNGIHGTEIKPMVLDTSSGWPYNKIRPGNKKAWLALDEENHVTAVDQTLLDDIRKRIALAERRINVPTVFVDTMKDERRLLPKVESCSTRLFANGPMDFTVVFRMYCSEFVSFIQEQRLNFECAVGLNCHSDEWGIVLNRLNQIDGERYIAGDFSNYDGSIQPQFMKAVGDLINDLYDDGEANRNVRDTLMHNIYNSVHLDGSDLYRVFKSNPSGNPITTVMNSLVNTMLMLYAWMETGHELGTYAEHVRAINYGDDNLLKVSEVTENFTMKSIAEVLAKIEITYTPATKDDHIYDFIPLSDVTFLQRSFVFDSSIRRWLAPLNRRITTESLYWHSSGISGWDAMESISESYVNESAHYGKVEYEANCARLRTQWEIHGRMAPCTFVSWNFHVKRMYEI